MSRNVEPCEQGRHAPHVVTRLAGRVPAPDNHVFDLAAVQLGNLLHHGAQNQGRQVVWPAIDERALHRASDRGPCGGDDDGVGHGSLLGDGERRWVPGPVRAPQIVTVAAGGEAP